MSTNSITAPSAIWVLQGEVAVFQGSKKGPFSLKSSAPTTCTVLVLFNKQRKITAMGHIDDYTSVRGVFNKIEILLRSMNSSLISEGFTASVLGASGLDYSLSNKELVLGQLEKLSIPAEQRSFSMVPEKTAQITVDVSTGKQTFLYEREWSKTLHYIQLREYGAFNDLLDYFFPGVKGVDIPFFEPKLASKREVSIPQIEGLEGSREEWAKNGSCYPIIKKLLSPFRIQIESYNKVQKLVSKLIMEKLKDFPILIKSDKEANYSLMLRQSASSKKCIELFELLLKNASSLDIDLTSTGKKSGSVWDVATKSNNNKALRLLYANTFKSDYEEKSAPAK